jgi:transcriptional regulator with GAF, ATPase, and Fis domain
VLVRETTEVSERMCIDAALKLAPDNHATAAELLGLSSQSWYATLRRHGLGALAPVEESK